MDKKMIDTWLNSKQGQQFHYKMEKIQHGLRLLGNPERAVPVIHVAGTNGKGSTTAFLRQLFVHHGLQTGTFTSPHLKTVHDRICLNGQQISQEDFQRLAERIYLLEKEVSVVYEAFSYFETMTLLFFLYMAEIQPDIAIVEVGIGGLYDTTNVVWPAVSIITSIGLDHQDMLGQDVAAIACQKAGIIKKGQDVVVGPMPLEALAVVKDIAEQQQAPLWLYGQDFQLREGRFSNASTQFCDVKLGLEGDYQMENASLALQAFLLYMKQIGHQIREEDVKVALRGTRWAGRLEKVQTAPHIYLDGSHNLPAMERLIEFIQQNESKNKTVLFSGLKRKDVGPMLDLLQEQLPEVTLVLTSFNHIESLNNQEFPEYLYTPSYKEFVSEWRLTAQADDFLLITGSLYFISEVRQQLFA